MKLSTNKRIEHKSGERGQSMVELALTVTFLMVLLAGTMDLGHAFFVWLQMRDAAQEGASYASICPSDATGVDKRVDANLDKVNSYHVDYDKSGTSIGDAVTVTVKTGLPITTPLLGAIIAPETNAISITATINDSVLSPSCPIP